MPESTLAQDFGPGAEAEYGALETNGIHCIAELYDCPGDLLNDEAFIRQALRDAVGDGKATLLHEVSHSFHPQGVTALGLIAESHVAIHTWPEYGYAAVDVFTCGDRASAVAACESLVRSLKAGRHDLKRLDRGMAVNGPDAVASGGRNVKTSKRRKVKMT